MSLWPIFVAVAAGWALQLWLTLRQTQAYLRSTAELRRHGAVATGKGGRRYRGGVAFVSLATDGTRVTAAVSLRGWTTFARPAPLPHLTGVRLGALAGDGEIAGLRDNERAAARDAARTLRSARRTAETSTATSGPDRRDVRITTGVVTPA
jgi:DNA-binding transcriptional regulator of glucitol operon